MPLRNVIGTHTEKIAGEDEDRDRAPEALPLLAGGPLVMDSIRSIRDAHFAAFVEHNGLRQFLDATTAHAILTVYDALSTEERRARMESFSVAGMADVAWKVLERARAA